ncbi:protein-glutamate O-methyltransferase CheR [Paenibacillus sp. 1011MAR3C5]|uniref:CheR family methyltransferase n=1 Tax=Paenibacillus sp. 1011MAR3C5 TaxID=1675787 RepID=UPI000E6C1DD7|nr:protein-glutamate O-methyltransferase CheR [Paenibacillus sp. 1011MAR3C5]RJE85100.1 protein-glutamate O-methyltransferase CheR [Paenibacillus sp. 1011MAR3C5]
MVDDSILRHGDSLREVDEELSDYGEIEELELDLLLEAIYRLRGFDFRHYLRSSLRRRVRHRMNLEKLPTISSLLGKVLHEEGFMEKLLEDFSIKVTEMFRDPEFFLAFRQKVVPHLQGLDELRIWHAGCATGEEVYSMAILLQEEGLLDRSIIYATDMSKIAIAQAKQGKFPLKRMQAYTRNYLQAGGTREFSAYYKTDHAYAFFQPEIKGHMMFAEHNLATDGSFNEFHVILCRNVLIYFDPELQSRVHRVLTDSLAPSGFLVLGGKESFLSPHKSSFAEHAPEERIFRKL